MISRPALPLTLLALLLAATFAVPFAAPQAAAPACPPTPDIVDPGTDHPPAVAAPTDQVTGLNRIDLTSACIAETAEAVALIATTAAAPTTTQGQTWTFNFNIQKAGTAYKATLTIGTATTLAVSPAVAGATSSVSGSKITILLPRAGLGAAPGSTLSDFFVDSRGVFVAAVSGNVFASTDRAPDTGAAFPAATSPYIVGSRAPPTLDTDGDGATDRGEIENGTDPNSIDTDHDGLLDGDSVEVDVGSATDTNYTDGGILVLRKDNALVQFAGEKEFGTNATLPDTDGDGLLDGANVTVPAAGAVSLYFQGFGLQPIPQNGGNELYLGEYPFGSDPLEADADGDGLDDHEEATGEGNPYTDTEFFPDIPGSTGPNNPDSDDDGLTDGEELGGEATLDDGSVATFTPTDPNGADTDHDGLTDLEELQGSRTRGTETLTFPATDPTKADTDGDGFDDPLEVESDSDPTDPNSTPKSGGTGETGGAETGYLMLSTVAMLVVALLSIVGILVRWG